MLSFYIYIYAKADIDTFTSVRAVSCQIHQCRKNSNVTKKIEKGKRKLVTNITSRMAQLESVERGFWSSGSIAFTILGVRVTCSYAHVRSVLECKNNAREQQEQGFRIHYTHGGSALTPSC